jgi:hypothetical protein
LGASSRAGGAATGGVATMLVSPVMGRPFISTKTFPAAPMHSIASNVALS